MMQTARVVAWVVAFASVACGGTTFVADGGDGGGGGGGDDASSPACPASIPSSNAPCTSEGIACEYGDGSHLACDTVARCSNGSWNVTPPDPTATNCGSTPSAACPATYADVPKGATCTEAGLDCTYDQGACGCTIPEGPPMFIPDGGSPAYTWICVTPMSGCPEPRPHLGSACSTEGLYCDYGSCTFSDGAAQTCMDGYWQGGFAACPAAAASSQ